MLCLDYRECGPKGEPKVVHVDQEFDYTITPVADSFEEFIRGLECEDAFDLEEESEAEVVSAWVDPTFAKTLGVDVPPDGKIK